MGLAEEADSTEVGAILPDDGQEGQVALTRPGNLSAGEDADAIGIQEQTDHHDGIEGRGAAGLVLVGGMDPREIERGDDIDQEEHEVVLRELGGGGVGPLGVELRCPRAIRFGAGWVHDRSHVRMGEDPSSSSPYGKIAQATKLSRSSESAVGFIDSLLDDSAMASRLDHSDLNVGPDSLLRIPCLHAGRNEIILDVSGIRNTAYPAASGRYAHGTPGRCDGDRPEV